MPAKRVFEQSIHVRASATTVERCLTDLDLMHQWLNPALRCEPVGSWETRVGSQCRFVIQIPTIEPALRSRVVEREPGSIVWAFEGFFIGRDRWECRPTENGTLLLNCFEFEIPNPLVAFGFDRFAAKWTKADMTAQLRRLKQVAERIALGER
ncbi:MAG: SRPBCC family protein [Cyanobacteria bacterium SID2]|nr:SRPBCC family protein [Cyanobacteria bacterium SID2]MBP0002163.1 SRPBCC family protein [Cyanobacteria bacterium SBC]